MYKIIGADQKEYGPISADQLRQWISEGRVNAFTKVMATDATEWKSMGELPEFAHLLPRPAPPLPGIAMGAPVPPGGRTNQMAIWALVVGILSVVCCCNILGPVSIVLGAVALSRLKNHPEERGSGFAIAGIILGIVALIILVTSVVIYISNPALFPKFPEIPQP